MGYRSEVVIKVYGDKPNMQEFKDFYMDCYNELSNEIQSYVDDLAASFSEDGKTFTFHARYIKWYSDYEIVRFFSQIPRLAKLADVAYEFVRIGEDDTDSETDYYGNVEYRLSVVRTIEGI
jgi:hypothetical protein